MFSSYMQLGLLTSFNRLGSREKGVLILNPSLRDSLSAYNAGSCLYCVKPTATPPSNKKSFAFKNEYCGQNLNPRSQQGCVMANLGLVKVGN